MADRIFAAAALVLASFCSVCACGSDVTAKDCKVQCDDTRTTCVQSCKDDACKTKCTTDFNNCTASCGKVTVKDAG